MEVKVKNLHGKMVDFNRFGMVLLAVSVFMFIGILIPNEGKTMAQTYVMMVSDTVLLAASFFFFNQGIKYKREIAKIKEDM
jgi:hypothetical protein